MVFKNENRALLRTVLCNMSASDLESTAKSKVTKIAELGKSATRLTLKNCRMAL